MLTREYYPLIRISRFHHKWVRGRALRALEAHRRIVDTIIDRDAELAELLMRLLEFESKAHLHNVMTAVEEASHTIGPKIYITTSDHYDSRPNVRQNIDRR